MPKNMLTPLISLPQPGTLGPSMAALSPSHQAFVAALMEIGTNQYSRAAAMAGYSATNKNALAVTGHRLAHDVRIQAAIQEESRRRLTGALALASSVLVDVIENQKNRPSDRLRAVEMLFNRTGLHATTEQVIAVTHKTVDDDALEGRIIALAGQLGLDPARLLGPNSKFGKNPLAPTEILDLEDFSPSAEGLEDLLS